MTALPRDCTLSQVPTSFLILCYYSLPLTLFLRRCTSVPRTETLKRATMEHSLAYSPAVCIRLIDDMAATLDHHCSLCSFFHEQDQSCQHKKADKAILRTATPFSDCSFYTAQSDVSEDSGSLSSRSSSSTIRAKIQVSTSSLKSHSLRRTSSPQEYSLRDLHQQQETQCRLRQQESEERLQQMYESQILAYLNSHHDNLGTIEE